MSILIVPIWETGLEGEHLWKVVIFLRPSWGEKSPACGPGGTLQCVGLRSHMTSLSPEMLGRYSATLLPGFTTQIRKWLHLLSFRTRPVYQFYPEEVGQRGPAGLNHRFGQQKDTSACIFFNVCYVFSSVCFNILQQEQFLLYTIVILIIIHVMTEVSRSYLIVQVLCVFCLYIINLIKRV